MCMYVYLLQTAVRFVSAGLVLLETFTFYAVFSTCNYFSHSLPTEIFTFFSLAPTLAVGSKVYKFFQVLT